MRRGPHLFIDLVFLTVGLLVFVAVSRSLLIINRPVPSDVIIVLSGDFAVRSDRALELAEQGYGETLLVDEGAEVLTFGRTLAERRVAETSGWATEVGVCLVTGGSTYEKSRERGTHLQERGAHRVLIVTSDFHTRLVVATFRKNLPSISFSVASATAEFSREHLAKRRWTKTYLNSICDFLLALEERPSPEVSAQVSLK